MYLDQVSLHNYKAFEEATLDLPATGVVLIVGPNNVGKTALLSVLDVLAGTIGLAAPRRVGSALPVGVNARFALSDEDREALFGAGGVGQTDPRDWLESDAFRWIEMHLREQGGSLQAEAISAPAGNGLVGDVGLITWDAPGTGVLEIVNLSNWFQLHRPGEDFERQEIARGGVGGELFSLTRAELAPLGDLMARWRSTLYHFRALRIGTDRSRSMSASPTLNPAGDNLPDALLYHFTQETREGAAIRETMEQLIPGVGRLVAPASGSNVEVMFEDPNLGVRQNIKDLGTGVEQVLLTAYVGITHVAGSLVVVEEPETNLHPDAQRRLLTHLLEWSKDKVFVLSTHSPTLLDRAAGSLPVWLVQRGDGKATLKRAELSMREVLEEIGVRLGDVLSADHIIVVEGDSDEGILETWFPDVLGNPRVVVTKGRGGDAAWQVDTVRRWIDAADTLERRILFVRDRDELRTDSIASLEKLGVHVLSRREIENFLIEPVAIAKALARRLRVAGKSAAEDPSPIDVEQQLPALADELRPQVVIKSVAQEIMPIRLLNREEVARLAESDPTLAGLLGVVGGNLPKADQLDKIEEKWRVIEAKVSAQWAGSWKLLAPGSDLLERLWKRYGLSYDKATDGQLIAASMETGPQELRVLLEGFIGT
jgi:AAA domain, putative AbiEii toxin, Type IV TA system/AAA ATPase domain